MNVAKPTKGSTVAIFGLGAVGLAVSISSLRLWFFIHPAAANLDILIVLFFLRPLKGLELQALLGLLGLILILRGLRKVINLSSLDFLHFNLLSLTNNLTSC